MGMRPLNLLKFITIHTYIISYLILTILCLSFYNLHVVVPQVFDQYKKFPKLFHKMIPIIAFGFQNLSTLVSGILLVSY